MKKEQFKISLVRPEGVTKAEMEIYIIDAVKNLSGSFSPSNPLFDLDRSSVRVSTIPGLAKKTKVTVKEKARKMTCPDCGDKTVCTFAPNPYAHDVNGDDTPVWMCENCRSRSAEDI